MMGIDENGLVVNLVQACLGSISANFLSVTLVVTGEKEVCCVFVLRSPSEEDEEEISDITFEFEALVSCYVNVEVVIRVGGGLPAQGRHVYIAKSPADDPQGAGACADDP